MDNSKQSAAPGNVDGTPRDAIGFRHRGSQTTRLESFVDAAFAFALSLVVIAVGSIPTNPEELALAMKSVPAYAACFWLIAEFWRGHVDWSERFGLDDSRSWQLSLLLIFLALIFVFPLKIVFAVFFAWITAGALPANFTFGDDNDVRLMFQTFAIAFGSMGAVLWALNHHAWLRRTDLGLDRNELLALKFVLRMWSLVPIFAVISLALSLWNASLGFGAPGLVFFLMHGIQRWMRARHIRMLASLGPTS